MSLQKRILVTGAAGFCGRHFCRSFRGNHEVVIGTYLKTQNSTKHRYCTWLPLDITNPISVQKLIQHVRPTEIYHLAAQSSARDSWQLEDTTIHTNAGGTIYFLEAMRRYVPHSKMLVVSTARVYPDHHLQGTHKEDAARMWPNSPYAVSKALSEAAALNYGAQFNLKVYIARPFNHVGTGQNPQFVLSDWCKQIAEIEAGQKDPTLSVGDIRVQRDFLSVADVVQAYKTILEKGRPTQVYDIASGESHPLEHHLNYLVSQSTKRIKIVKDPNKMRRSEIKVLRSPAKNLRNLGWEPKKSIELTLSEMLHEWRGRIGVG